MFSKISDCQRTRETVKSAIDLGVDVNVANVDGRTALDLANGLGYRGVIELLLEKGARSGGG